MNTIASKIPSVTKCVLGLLGTALAVYAFASPYLHSFIPAPIALGISGVALLLTAVLHDSAPIQTVAGDIPGVLDGSVSLTKAVTDVQGAINGLIAAQTVTQAQVASVQATTSATHDIVQEASNAIAAAPVVATPIPAPVLSAFDTAAYQLRDVNAPVGNLGIAPQANAFGQPTQ